MVTQYSINKGPINAIQEVTIYRYSKMERHELNRNIKMCGNQVIYFYEFSFTARIITTLMTTNDLTILIRFVIMLALVIWVTAMVLHYWKSVTKAE